MAQTSRSKVGAKLACRTHAFTSATHAAPRCPQHCDICDAASASRLNQPTHSQADHPGQQNPDPKLLVAVLILSLTCRCLFAAEAWKILLADPPSSNWGRGSPRWSRAWSPGPGGHAHPQEEATPAHMKGVLHVRTQFPSSRHPVPPRPAWHASWRSSIPTQLHNIPIRARHVVGGGGEAVDKPSADAQADKRPPRTTSSYTTEVPLMRNSLQLVPCPLLQSPSDMSFASPAC